ncbi:hypothetical protein OAG89_02870 [Pseudomonadales bacterium]|nr:hypothetical protein [Pseudomonadales bacterium]
MFYEYALDPDILTDVSRCRTFFESFDGNPSRLISDVPRNWLQDAFNAINQLPHEQCLPRRKKFLKNELKKLVRHNLIKTRGTNSNIEQLPWCDFTAQEHKSFPFSGVFGVMEKTSPIDIYSFDDLLFEKPDSWNSLDQLHVERRAQSIVGAMTPLLLVSKTVRLIDPYFSFIRPNWENYEPVLKELAGRLDQYNFGRGIKTLSIHTSDRWGSMPQQLVDETRAWLPEGVTIKVYHWLKDEMHDRFVLTDVGGLQFGHGLSEFSPGKPEQVLVTALDNSSFRRELDKVSGGELSSYEAQG